MRSRMLLAAMKLAAVPVVQSCGNRVETSLALPPAADYKVDAEPAFPEAALAPCPTNLRSDPCPAEQAEREWWTQALAWGRAHRDRVSRVCMWARELKKTVPEGY